MIANKYRERIAELVRQIKGLHPRLEIAAKAFREGRNSEHYFDKWTATHWCVNAYGNALIRLRILVEQNFEFIETIGLLAVARYVFEISVWLRLLKSDSRFGMIYYRELLECQLRYYKDTVGHYVREVQLLQKFEQDEAYRHSAVLTSFKAGEIDKNNVNDAVRSAMEEVDTIAGRSFSVFCEDAKVNGYGFQAHLVEEKAIPQIQHYIHDIEQELAEFHRRVPTDINDLVKGRWQWRQMAERVGISDEHDYIYAHASKLTHATPASLTTDAKNLELPEVFIFLRYIHTKLLEALHLASEVRAIYTLH